MCYVMVECEECLAQCSHLLTGVTRCIDWYKPVLSNLSLTWNITLSHCQTQIGQSYIYSYKVIEWSNVCNFTNLLLYNNSH